MRLLVLGMGGHLGTAAARLVGRAESVRLSGIDIEPPRRLLRSESFFLVMDPTSSAAHEQIVGHIVDFSPTHVVHFGVFEPHARSNPQSAHRRSMVFTEALLAAASRIETIAHVAVRSGTEVYGRRHGDVVDPDESVPARPTSGFGNTMADVETLMADWGKRAAVPVARLRFAPIAGPHTPSPLTRVLRLPLAVPVGLFPDSPFSLLHIDDAARATAAVIARRFDGAVNIVGSGALTGAQAAVMGGRVPVPTVGPGWLVARLGAATFGCPLPEHVIELLSRGRTANGDLARARLGFVAEHATVDIVRELYDWPESTEMDLERRAEYT